MINKEEIFVNESHWAFMNQEQFAEFAAKIFGYYRENGFPYYPTDAEYRQKEFEKLKKFDYKTLFDGDVIKQSMHGLALAWSYFPHAFDVRCNDMMTPYEAFMNDEIFQKVIAKRLKMGSYMSDSGIRKMLKIYTNVQGVSNFRPTAAACIYDKYAKNGIVWDMSGGWGGRLLGAVIADVEEYITTEPSSLTCDGLCKLAADFHGNMNYQIHCCGSEEFKPYKQYLDLCFTSPPYFDLEKYSNEVSQSYIKYNTKKDWIDGFLAQTFENCYCGLKNGGHMIINIADVKGKHNLNLENETKQLAKKIGFKFNGELKLALSNINMRGKEVKFKYEPIFIFEK